MLMPSLLNGIVDDVKNWFTGFLDLIPKACYMLITMIFNIMDLFQTLFRKIAGMDTVYFFSETGVPMPVGGDGNDIVLTLLNNNTIRDAIYAMIFLSIVLLFVFTIISILRTEYNAEDSKSASKGRVIGKSLRALGLFFLVPVICYMGIFLSNNLLMTLDKATTPLPNQLSAESLEVFEQGYYLDIFGTTIKTTNTPFSGMAFRASAYSANRIRNDQKFANFMAFDGETDGTGITFGKTFMPTADSSTGNLTGREVASNKLDDAFANGYLLKEGKQISINERVDKIDNYSARVYLKKMTYAVVFATNDNNTAITMMNKNRVNLVWFYYNLWEYDFVLGLGVIFIMTALILNITLGVMKRVFDLLILTIISPPIAATLPLDNGEAFKKWRVKYVAKTIQAYGPIVAMNLFFMIVPFIREFSFIGYTSEGVYKPVIAADYLIQSFFVIVGLVAVKDISKTLSDMIGAEDAQEGGKAISGDVAGTALKTAAVTSKAAAVGATMAVAPAKAVATKMFSGKAEGKAAYEKTLKETGDVDMARAAQRQARSEASSQKALESVGNSIGSVARGSLDMLQQTGKGAFAGTPYAKAFEEANSGKYGAADIMKNLTGGESANFKGIPIGTDGKSKFFVGKNVKEAEKQKKDSEKDERAKRKAIETVDKEMGIVSSGAGGKPKAGGTTKTGSPAPFVHDTSKFGKTKSEKAERELERYFSELNRTKYHVKNLEFELKDVQEANEKLLTMFKNEHAARAGAGKFREAEYARKIEDAVRRHIDNKGYKY